MFVRPLAYLGNQPRTTGPSISMRNDITSYEMDASTRNRWFVVIVNNQHISRCQGSQFHSQSPSSYQKHLPLARFRSNVWNSAIRSCSKASLQGCRAGLAEEKGSFESSHLAGVRRDLRRAYV